jgi:transposase
MRGDLRIRKVRTSSGATAVQVIGYQQGKRIVLRHIGSARTDDELTVLYSQAEIVREELCRQPSLFAPQEKVTRLLHQEHLQLQAVTHCFAHQVLRECSQQCGLSFLPSLYQDLALMRIIEPASKLHTIELLKRYFEVSYAERTLYRLLPKLITHKDAIEKAAYQTACTHFGESFALVLYDVTTLYFESHEADDKLRARGFSKDDKSKQPQIVVGLLVTLQGFPLMHEVYKGNTFEGHTMLGLVKEFQKHHQKTKPIIVADAAMLSQENIKSLEAQGYQYIVGARLSNTTESFMATLTERLERQDGALVRLAYPNRSYHVICTYSQRRATKDRYELNKQLARANELIARKEPGKRAKFVKKSSDNNSSFVLDEELKKKAEKLLGIKGYITNIPEDTLPNEQIITYYQELWHIEQSFRISKTDLKTRPIFHYKHEAIKAHVLLCFMGLMMGKFLEIKSGLSLQRIRDILWNVHEAHIEDTLTGKRITLQTNLEHFKASGLQDLLKPH